MYIFLFSRDNGYKPRLGHTEALLDKMALGTTCFWRLSLGNSITAESRPFGLYRKSLPPEGLTLQA